MSYNSNTSQFVKTYGKPRRTQRLGQDSLWHDTLTDDFDKCLGIEDVQQTTFISPEQAGPVKIYNRTKNKNTINTFGGWSQHLQSTLTGHKSMSKQKRNIECSFDSHYNKKRPSLKNTEINKKDKHFTKMNSRCSSSLDTESDISSNLKVSSRFKIQKSKAKFIVPLNQCSSPLQRSLIAREKQLNTISSKKKKKKIEPKTKLVCALNGMHASKLSDESDCSYINNSNFKAEAEKKYNQLGKSILISGSRFPLVSKNKYAKNAKANNHRIRHKKLKNTNGGHSDWFNKISNYFCNEKILSPEKSSKNLSLVITDNKTKSLELQKEESLIKKTTQSTKYIYKNLSKEVSATKLNKSNEIESCYSHDIIELSNTTSKNCKLFTLCDENSSKLSDNSLYVSCCQVNEKEIIEDINSSSIICINNINVSVDNQPSIIKPMITNCNSPQLIQCATSSNSYTENVIKKNLQLSLNKSYDNTNELCASSFDTKLSNLFEQRESNKSNNCVNFNQNRLSMIENISRQSNNIELDDSASNSHILLDITNKISNISFNDEIKRCNQLSNLSLCKSIINNDISNDSNSHKIYTSSSSEQDTVICEQKSSYTILKNNTDSSDTFLRGKSVKSNSCSRYSNNEQLFNKVCMFPDNCQNELFNSRNGGITITEKSQSNYNGSCNYLLNQFENPNTEFKDISYIEYEEQTTSKNHTLMYNNNTFDDKFKETSASNFSETSSRRKRYASRFENSVNLNNFEETVYENNVKFQNSTQRYLDCSQSVLSQQNSSVFYLKPGKKWRRSIVIVRNYIDGQLDQTTNFTANIAKGRNWISTVDDVLQRQSINTSIYQKLDQSSVLRNSVRFNQRYSENNSTENEIAKKYIFERCNQKQPITFESWLNPKIKKTWKKVGEGVYGEVFSYTFGKSSTVVKIIPIEGETYINNEQQKMMFEVYSEVLIASELNKLCDKNGWNHTNSFCKLKNISCVQGKYPKHLIGLWEEFDCYKKGSDNDNPRILPNTQMFMILEMEDGGVDVESFVFNSASQSLYAFIQIVFGLAVAEQQFNFEHRDLHIGNILVKKVAAKKQVSFTLDGETFKIPSRGIKITIIDFTLSRMTHYNKPIYNNLSKDNELFTSVGDYQFEIYRLMRKETNDQWNSYKPRTNIYWLHYVLDKMLTSVHYKNASTTIHQYGLSNLLKLKNSILYFDCAKKFAESRMILDFFN